MQSQWAQVNLLRKTISSTSWANSWTTQHSRLQASLSGAELWVSWHQKILANTNQLDNDPRQIPQRHPWPLFPCPPNLANGLIPGKTQGTQITVTKESAQSWPSGWLVWQRFWSSWTMIFQWQLLHPTQGATKSQQCDWYSMFDTNASPEYGFHFTARTSFTRTSGAFIVTCTRTTHRMSTDNCQLNRIQKMLCEKVAVFRYIVNNFTNCAPLPMNSDVINDVKYA